MKKILASDFGIHPSNDKKSILNVYKMIEYLKEHQETCIVFVEGEYHFYPDYASEKLLCISNHEEDTLKRIAFPLVNLENITFKGEGTHFKFHTEIIPFYLENCRGIQIEGIEIDYARTAYSEGEIVEASEDRVVFSIDKDNYPYEIKHRRIYFQGENFIHELGLCLEIDSTTYGPTYDTKDIYLNEPTYAELGAVFRELEPGIVEMCLTENKLKQFKTKLTVGNKLILRHHPRSHPAYFVKDSEDVILKDNTIFHAAGMGFIAQHTRNITLDNVQIKVNPDNKRVFTTTADATHFVYCSGKIVIKNCLFENQLDDPVNIHGIYAQITDKLSDTEIIVKLVHFQQLGVRIGKVGDKIGFTNNETMLRYEEAIIEEIKPLNKEYTYIKVKKTLANIELGHVIENLEYIPDVVIQGCTFRNNRARGCLLTSAGDVLVENNYFHIAGAAILVEGDANYWFESGAIQNITIKNNIFDNCAYVSDWGKAPIQVTPVVKKVEVGETRYHKKMLIADNKFYCFDERLIHASHIEEIIFTNNEITKTNRFPALGHEKFVLNHVNKMEIL